MAQSRSTRFIFTLLVLASTGSAQYAKQETGGFAETKGLGWETYPRQQDQIFSQQSSECSGRVLHYQLDLNFTQGFTNNTPFYSGVERITWKPEGDSLVVLDAASLRIDSVVSGGQRLSFDTSSTAAKLRIALPAQLRSRDSLFIDIWYAYTGSGRRGYYYYEKNVSNPNPSAWTLERLGYTFTEPYDSPYWFPCVNDPSVKVPCRINVTVPEGYLAGSNGLLKQTIVNVDGTLTFRWEEQHPIAMYLMVVTISKYSTFSHFYRMVTNPSDSIEIKYYVWQADSAGSGGSTYNAVNAFRNVLDMMRFFSKVFGEYPYDKYGMAAVYPFGAGGMEHQTMTTIHRNWISGNGSQGGIAHELAHQWWGDMVTCATWADIWLNEGFATYSEALWEERFYNTQTFRNLMQTIQHFSAASWLYPIYNPPPNFLFGDLVYSKGAWVLHMLRYVLGDSAFFNVFNTYRQRFEHKSATTNDFALVASDVSQRDMNWFFNQWVYRNGWPVYAYRWNAQLRVGGGYDLTVTIQQQQSEAVFQMPVQLTVRMGGIDSTVVVNNTSRVQSFDFAMPLRPDTVLFDRDGWILKQMSTTFLSDVGKDEGVPNSFELSQNFPNPFNPTTLIRFQLPDAGFVSLKIYNVLGQELATLVNQQQSAGRYEVRFDGSALTSGMYFYRLSVVPFPGEKRSFVETKKMVLAK